MVVWLSRGERQHSTQPSRVHFFSLVFDQQRPLEAHHKTHHGPPARFITLHYYVVCVRATGHGGVRVLSSSLWRAMRNATNHGLRFVCRVVFGNTRRNG